MDRAKDFKTVLLRPAFAPVDVWCTISGLGRRVTYELIGAGHLKAIKRGTSTLVDVDAGLEFLRSLPAAKIKPSKKS